MLDPPLGRSPLFIISSLNQIAFSTGSFVCDPICCNVFLAAFSRQISKVIHLGCFGRFTESAKKLVIILVYSARFVRCA